MMQPFFCDLNPELARDINQFVFFTFLIYLWKVKSSQKHINLKVVIIMLKYNPPFLIETKTINSEKNPIN